MQYTDFSGLKLSRLGMGNMRLPTGADGQIDVEKAKDIIGEVYRGGVNYFDTAYMYHDGTSETFLGEALAGFDRGSFFLADKMPGMMMEMGQDPSKVFEEQLRRCRTGYFDFYLLHSVCAETIPIYEDEKTGIIPYLLEQKRLGRIRHLGLSSHSTPADLQGFLDRHDCFEYVQIELNYLDWTMQDAKSQYEIITRHGLPVWVMEPCRGGRLASLVPEADALLKAARPDASIASWAFLWVQSLPGVQVVLSGMTSLEQARDNLKTFSAPVPLSEAEKALVGQAAGIMLKKVFVPCTKCHYCDGCPAGLDIPGLIEIYNQYRLDASFGAKSDVMEIPADRLPSACIGCGRCAHRCPQSIAIPDVMKELAQIRSAVEKEWE